MAPLALQRAFVPAGLLNTAFLIILLGAGTADSQAQIVGVKAGATFSTLDVQNNDGGGDVGSVSSFAGGGFIRFRLGAVVFQPELLVATKGGTVRVPFINDDIEIKIDYLEMPVLLRFARPLGRYIPYVQIGPAFAFEIRCMLEADIEGNHNTDECDDRDDPDPSIGALDTKNFDIGLTGVLGAEIRAGPGNILVDGRYTHGLRNIAPEQLGSAKNRSWAVLAGYAIELSRIWR